MIDAYDYTAGDYLDERELEVLKLQNAINIAALSNNSLINKLDDVSKIQNEIKNLRERIQSRDGGNRSGSKSNSKEKHPKTRLNFSPSLMGGTGSISTVRIPAKKPAKVPMLLGAKSLSKLTAYQPNYGQPKI